MKTLTKNDLIDAVSGACDLSPKEAEVLVGALFDTIVRFLRDSNIVDIRGFGRFKLRQRQPRNGRNPKTGARVEVPAKKIAYFRPSTELTRLANGHPGKLLLRVKGAVSPELWNSFGSKIVKKLHAEENFQARVELVAEVRAGVVVSLESRVRRLLADLQWNGEVAVERENA